MALKSKSAKVHTSGDKHLEVMKHEYRNDFVCSNNGFHFALRFSAMRETLSRRLQSEKIFMLGSIFMHGFLVFVLAFDSIYHLYTRFEQTEGGHHVRRTS